MPKLKLLIEYDGTHYAGWQRQPNQETIQGKIEEALTCITQERLSIVGAGRTDAGVHASGQVASFSSRMTLPEQQWARALNRYLPYDISIITSRIVPDSFHAQRDAKEKIYEYRIHLHSSRTALDYYRAWHLFPKLNIPAIRQGLNSLTGTHDFRSFQGPRASTSQTICTISTCSLELSESHLVISIRGNRFLKQMVRNIVGTLVEVGQEKRSPNSLQDVLAARNRQAAGKTAPPQGLYLREVFY